MICPECGEVMAPGPLDARRGSVDPGSHLKRLLRRVAAAWKE
jgi:hypothetical protein